MRLCHISLKCRTRCWAQIGLKDRRVVPSFTMRTLFQPRAKEDGAYYFHYCPPYHDSEKDTLGHPP